MQVPSCQKDPPRRKWLSTPAFPLLGGKSWTEEPGGQSMGSQRVGYNWATNNNTFKRNFNHHKKCCFFRWKVQLIATYHYLFEVVNSLPKRVQEGNFFLFLLSPANLQNLKDKVSMTWKCSTAFEFSDPKYRTLCLCSARFYVSHQPLGSTGCSLESCCYHWCFIS